MRLLKIKACNMREALEEARARLGDEAAVLHTRQYDEPVFFGMVRRRGVEILVGSDDREPDPVGVISAVPERPRSSHVERLVRNGVPRGIAEAVLAPSILDDSCRPPVRGKGTDAVMDAIAGRIRCTGPVKCNGEQVRLALVGPTGVGKTTTAARIAAQYALNHKKKVALVTLDTYRIGAVEQLATYARILQIPLETAMCPEEGEALLAKHADKDLIVIDTAGTSQRNGEHISELGAFLRFVRPTETHLVLSASASSAARQEAVESFGRLGADRLILTKLDECPLPGCVLEMALIGLMPFSFVTHGQEVPDDLVVAESEQLAKFAWEGVL